MVEELLNSVLHWQYLLLLMVLLMILHLVVDAPCMEIDLLPPLFLATLYWVCIFKKCWCPSQTNGIESL